MTRDRRGFTYALEPVRKMTDWEIDRIGASLVPLNEAAQAARERVALLMNHFGAARADVIAQRAGQAALDIAGQRRAHHYMVQVQEYLQAANIELRRAEEERDALYRKLVEARKFAESLERDKEQQAGEHDQKVAKQGYQLSDDNWLQRIHWRKNSDNN